jgi:RNA polymerase sigma factor (sigma-70 family)
MESEFEQTIKENAGILHKLCRVYTYNADEYEELFQEMLVQVWRSTKNFRGEAKISTWIYQICINTALSFRSKLARSKKRFETLDGKIFVQPAYDTNKDEQLQRLYDAIRELRPIDRAIVSLYLDEKSYEETAQILGISKTNAATRLMRLKKQLMEIIIGMNEEELKELWQADRTAPTIDFAAFQKLLMVWQNKLRRKARIDIWAQSIATGLYLIPVFFYPRLIFAYVLVVILAVWYVRELRRLSNLENSEADYAVVRYSLNAKIQTMKSYFRRTRFVMYVLTPLIFHVAGYGMGGYDKPPTEPADWTSLLIKSIIFSTTLYEILTFIATEIYFKILYTPALNELKNLVRQLDAHE